LPTRSDEVVLVDTSAALPFVLANHPDHGRLMSALGARPLGLAGHAAYETYSVLTRLPEPYRLPPAGAARVVHANFPHSVHLPDAPQTAHLDRLARAEITGGAVYDGLVALAAVAHDRVLCTRDGRALRTYRALGARVELLT
jgi:toxin FitB